MPVRVVSGWFVVGCAVVLAGPVHAEDAPANDCAPIELDLGSLEALETARRGASDPAAVMNLVNPDAEAELVWNRAAGADRVVSARKHCLDIDDASRCTLHLGVIEPGADGALVLAHDHTLDPPHVPWEEGGGTELTRLATFESGGQSIAALVYDIDTEPQPAVGWTTHQVLVLMDVDTGALLYDAEVGRGGQASVHEVCTWSAQIVDPDCKGARELVLEQRCGEAHCFEVDAQTRAADPESYEDCDPPVDRVTRTPL